MFGSLVFMDLKVPCVTALRWRRAFLLKQDEQEEPYYMPDFHGSPPMLAGYTTGIQHSPKSES